MLPSTWMDRQEKLQQLLARQAALKRELTGKKQALQEAQRRQRHTLTRQIRRAQARLSSADRKRRTRRLILIGSYVDSVSQADPEAMTRLMKGLEAFLRARPGPGAVRPAAKGGIEVNCYKNHRGVAEKVKGLKWRTPNLAGPDVNNPYPFRYWLFTSQAKTGRWCAVTSVRRGPGHRDGRRGMLST